MARLTMEQLRARQDRLREQAKKQQREMAAAQRRLRKAETQLTTEAYAALGRAVAEKIGVETVEAWEAWHAKWGAKGDAKREEE